MGAVDTPVPPVGLDGVRAARELLAGVVSVTPMAGSRALSELCGGPVWLKCENLQRTGSFKIRGAYTRIARLDAAERARGVVAASAGNHAQGVALAAQMLGIRATVFMPERAAIPKVGATRGYGAAGRTWSARRSRTASRPPRSSPSAPAPCSCTRSTTRTSSPGRARSGSRCWSRCRTCARCSCAPVAAGCSAGSPRPSRGSGPTSRWSGCRPTGPPRGRRRWPPAHRARSRACARSPTASRSGRPGDVTFPQVAALVDEIVTVGEDALSRALLHCLERAKLLVEPAGAAAVAALLEHPKRFATPAGRRALRAATSTRWCCCT